MFHLMGDTYFPTMILRDITQFDRLFQARKLLLNLQIPHINATYRQSGTMVVKRTIRNYGSISSLGTVLVRGCCLPKTWQGTGKKNQTMISLLWLEGPLIKWKANFGFLHGYHFNILQETWSFSNAVMLALLKHFAISLKTMNFSVTFMLLHYHLD